MYAVFEKGGKQYRVKQGQVIRLEKIVADEGAALEFDQVLLISEDGKTKIGQPYVAGAKVLAKVAKHGRDKKINIIKFKRRKHQEKQMGHRQWFTEVEITAINAA